MRLLYSNEGVALVIKSVPSNIAVYLLKKYGASVGDNVRILRGLIIAADRTESASYYFKNLKIGDNVFIGRNCFFDLTSNISIGSNTCISHEVGFITHFNGGVSFARSSGMFPVETGAIVLEAGVYIGFRCTILKAITIGENAVVGACSLVNKDIVRCSLSYGVPAKTSIKHTN